jgi:hypothetical protein
MIVAELGLIAIVGILIILVIALASPLWMRLIAGIGKQVSNQVNSASDLLEQTQGEGDEKNDSQNER